MYTDV